VELIGLETDLLDVVCPFSYIATSTVFAYEIPYKPFYSTMQDLNPRGILDLRNKCAQKFNWLMSIWQGKTESMAACQGAMKEFNGDVKKEIKINRQVLKQFPFADKAVTFTLKREIKQRDLPMNAQPGRPAAYPTKGFFKLEDMIRLEKLKKEIFTDYGRVEKYIENLHDKMNDQKPRNDLRIKINRSMYVADDPLKPMSYTGITNPSKEVTFISKPLTKSKARVLFVESFENPYFEAQQRK
jgi:hypothetical protein